MHIKFKRIDIQNFMSIGRGNFDLDNQGYVLINGINKNVDDNAKSNGAGKSSCVEAIIYALTGDTVRGTKDVVNKNASGGCRVTLEFEIDGVPYKLIRTKEDAELGTNLKFFIKDKDVSGKGVRDTQKKLEECLPELNASLIGSVIILGQGLPQRFTNNTPAGRKEVLEKLSKSDFMIEDIKDKLSIRKSELNTKLRGVEDTLLSLGTQKSMLEHQKAQFEQDKKNIVPMDYDSLIAQLKQKLDIAIGELGLLNQEKGELNTQLKQAQEKHNALVYEELKSIYDEKEKELTELHIKPFDTLISTLSTTKSSKEAEIKRLEAIVDVCPTCGQKLQGVEKIDTSPLKDELEKIKTQLTENLSLKRENELLVKEELDKLTLKNNEIKQKSLDALNDITTRFEVKERECSQKQDVVNTLQVEHEKLLLAKDTYDKKYATLDTELEKISLKLDDISKKMIYNTSDKEGINSHLDIVSKMATIASRDFRGFLLSEIVKFIDNKAKDYSQDIFQTDKVAFRLDGNNISISYCEKEYENLSGGEKQRIDLIVQFAIRDMLTQFMDFSSNIIVLDEIFDNLDSVGCQNVINMLSARLTDIESVYIITHHSDSLDIPYDKQLYVVKSDKGISEIR